MKPLDQFKRTPPRRYDQAPPPPPEDKRTLEPAIRKRYFDVPSFSRGHIDRWLGGAVGAVMLLTLCNASAPMGDVPTVQQRFTQWAAVQNEKTVQRLPGPTPEPDSALAAAAQTASRSPARMAASCTPQSGWTLLPTRSKAAKASGVDTP